MSSPRNLWLGETNRKFPNLSKTTCPGGMSGFITGITGGIGLGCFFTSSLFGCNDSFTSIAFLMLIFLSGGGTASCGRAFLGNSSTISLLLLGGFSGSGGCSSDQSSRSARFLKRELLDVAAPICIFHLVGTPLAVADAVASATACLAFCSRVGDGESRIDRFGLSLNSPLWTFTESIDLPSYIE